MSQTGRSGLGSAAPSGPSRVDSPAQRIMAFTGAPSVALAPVNHISGQTLATRSALARSPCELLFEDDEAGLAGDAGGLLVEGAGADPGDGRAGGAGGGDVDEAGDEQRLAEAGAAVRLEGG